MLHLFFLYIYEMRYSRLSERKFDGRKNISRACYLKISVGLVRRPKTNFKKKKKNKRKNTGKSFPREIYSALFRDVARGKFSEEKLTGLRGGGIFHPGHCFGFAVVSGAHPWRDGDRGRAKRGKISLNLRAIIIKV